MQPTQPTISNSTLSNAAKHAIDEACKQIASTWPLDQFIAVNPWWEMTKEPIEHVAAKLKTLAGSNALMPRSYFKALWQEGAITEKQLNKASLQLAVNATTQTLLEHLDAPVKTERIRLLSDLLDDQRDLAHTMSWHDEITHQISQFCAAYFNQGTMLDYPSDKGLYQSWLSMIRQDIGIEILMDVDKLAGYFKNLPDTYEQLYVEAITELEISDEALTTYCHALLLSINGWASWAAYQRWQAQLNNQTTSLMHELLAIRMAWGLVLWRHSHSLEAKAQWRMTYLEWETLIPKNQASQHLDWCWQTAAEIAYQEQLNQQLAQADLKIKSETAPVLQAAFCIDVRSEVIRRALEKQSDLIQTIGFAGFFGLPIDYQPAGSDFVRPQLPGLLKPTIRAREVDLNVNSSPEKRRSKFFRQANWHRFSRTAPATFTYVEATGIFYAFKLLKASLFPSEPNHPINALNTNVSTTFELSNEAGSLSLEAKKNLAAGILGAMSLTQNFAPIVLLIGHGSETCNNPFAAGLDCGACGGQTGEVNVRVLAQLLNDSEIRDALSKDGIDIPIDTCFLPGLHNTTTDNIHLYDLDKWCTDADNMQTINTWLAAASSHARIERAEKLGIGSEKNISKSILNRSKDWSQTRPEWGLANNACFIVAPRSRTQHINLEGRSFLHNYQWQQDKTFSVLELIMTAPMIVTHWINMQYYASVTDNGVYGSGNKVLHNVVGGNLGVFEGNGGDLRIGLSMQSLHNGQQWMHQPLRLSVYIAAPKSAMEAIVNKNQFVKHLIDHNWLYLFRLEDTSHTIERYYQDHWSIQQMS